MKLTFNEKDVESVVPNPKEIPYILKDDVVNFFITFKKPFEHEEKFCFEYVDSVTNLPYKSEITVSPDAENQPYVDRMSHLKVLRSLENSADDGISIEDQMLFVKVKDFKQEAIKYSVKHQVLSKFTSFLCVGKELVDGQYQEFKNQQVEKVKIQQPIPREADLERIEYLSNSLQQSANSFNIKCAKSQTKKSSGFGFGGIFESIGGFFGGRQKNMSMPASECYKDSSANF